MNRYTGTGCNLTHTSSLRITRVFSGCFESLLHNGTAFLRWDGGSNLDNRIQYYGQDCGRGCLDCKSAVHDNAFGSCTDEMGGAGTLFYPST